MFLGFFQPQGFNSATSCFRCSLVGRYLSGCSDWSRDRQLRWRICVMMTGNSKPEHRVSVHLRQRLACDFSAGKHGSIHFLKTRTVMSWENMNYMIILKLCWCFMFLILPDGCPALTEEGTKEAALDPLMICACSWHWRIGLDRWSKRLRKACGTMGRPPLEMYASVCYWFLCDILCYYDLLFWKVICICCRHYILRHTIYVYRHIRYLSISNKRLAPGEFGNLKMSWLRIY